MKKKNGGIFGNMAWWGLSTNYYWDCLRGFFKYSYCDFSRDSLRIVLKISSGILVEVSAKTDSSSRTILEGIKKKNLLESLQ